jgi:TnpA family transposase
MSRRHIFTERQRAALFDLPTDELSLLKFYTLGDDDLENIRQRRRPENRIGFALQLCALRYPGRALAPGEMIPREVLSFVGAQLGVPADALLTYATRRQTRQQHMDTLREIYGYKTFTGRGARDLRGVDFRPGRRCQIKRGSCSSFYCAVSGNFHHSARSIDNRALVRGCSGRR